MTDLINHPPHYTTAPDGWTGECIDYTVLMSFSQGNAFKYLWRAGLKGHAAEDLDKARWYLANPGYSTNILNIGGWDRIELPEPVTKRDHILVLIATGETATARRMAADLTVEDIKEGL